MPTAGKSPWIDWFEATGQWSHGFDAIAFELATVVNATLELEPVVCR